jgi:protein prenyltransferase alpha subunit repeat containing protein 1
LANHDIQVCVQKEFQLCAKASSSYPRNYYAWTYRYWIVSSYCSSQTDKLLQEYNDTRRWIELNISDYSGFQYLQQLMTLLLPALNRDRHMDWVNSLVIKYPGHESLWCHKRYCSSIYIGSIDYCYSQHQFVHDIMNGRFRDQSLSDLAQDLTAQEEFALKFGLWQTLLVSNAI